MMYARYGGAEHSVERPLALLRKAIREGRFLRWSALGAAIVTIIATAAQLAGPLIVRAGVDEGLAEGDAGLVTRAGIAYLAVLAVEYFAQSGSLYLIASVGERYLRTIRVRVFTHLLSLEVDYFARTKTGVLVSRMTSDVEALNQFTSEGAVTVITSALTALGVIVAMFLVDPLLAFAVLMLMPILLGASLVFRHYADRAYQAIREQIGRVLGTMQEGISGVRVVQAYTQESEQAVFFGRVNRDYYDANIQAAKAISTYFPVVDFLNTVAIAVVLVIGGLRVIDGAMSIGSLVAFLLYLRWFFEPIVQLSNVYNLLQAALAALSKLFGILDRSPEIAEPASPTALPEGGLDVGFNGVRFGYDADVEILHGIDLEVAAGERLAVVGTTGAGKSTLAKLAVRFHDPTAGSVTVGGVDLRSLAIDDLRHAIALVPQEGFLFSGSLRNNLRYAVPDASDDQIWGVCETVGIRSWIETLPDGLDTEVRERGTRLSSGERQLVALARALLADPRVIVLDEATSNLDPETEAMVEAALNRLLEGRTSIVIAHRLKTAERADRVIVVEEGQIVESGPAVELEASDGPFARLSGVWGRHT